MECRVWGFIACSLQASRKTQDFRNGKGIVTLDHTRNNREDEETLYSCDTTVDGEVEFMGLGMAPRLRPKLPIYINSFRAKWG